MKKIYICHPLVGDGSLEWGDMARNVDRYLRFVALAMNQGHCVLSWVHHYEVDRRGWTRGKAQFYLERDMLLLQHADEVWIAGPLSVSKGMRQEYNFACRYGIFVRKDPQWEDPKFLPGVFPDPSTGEIESSSSILETVDHPVHYGGADDVYEAIKVIDAWGLGFSLGNAVKYLCRAGNKDPGKTLEDLKKARWYLDHEIGLRELGLSERFHA
jgi:hypothetical protein